MQINNDTICAMATPTGGAIGVIRLSGPESIVITDRIFHAQRGKRLLQAKPNTIHYGTLQDLEGKVLDDVLVSVFHAPHSYTGEDSVEISCHGSRYILQQVLHTVIQQGARQARPGEYTERAFLNGKMDLSQAEAVADLVSASNRASHQMALSQLRGHFSGELSQLRNQLLKMTSLLELELDFSDHEDLEFAKRDDLLDLAERIDKRITELAHSFQTGKALKEGIPVAIIGKTNVGKSTLLNQLLHEDRAIVSDIHGTTRDVIEDTTDIHGITFRFIDTAGIRHTQDTVEQLGIERTYQKMEEATIILWLVDEPPTQKEIEEVRKRAEKKKLIVILNKIDKNDKQDMTLPHLSISAKYGKNLNALEEAIYQAANIPEVTENDVIITNARHYESLIRAHDSISRVIQGLHQGLSGDLLSEDLRICLEQLGEITGGQICSQEVLNNIFSHFCVGK